ncbi:MAG TPA: hypothetical protein VFO16_11850 [Pseudonocardiaceae bacterium]|nr:hypothetical protein [Pseudonocardiaceae bacterium]
MGDRCCERPPSDATALAWSRPGHHDLCAALRTAALIPEPDREAGLIRLLARCRDTGRLTERMRPGEIDLARSAVKKAERRAQAGRRPEGVVAMSLARMVAGEMRRLVLIELGPEGLCCCEILRNPDGSLHVIDRGLRDVWAELTGGQADSEQRRFVLAGGVGDEEPPPRRERSLLGALARRYLRWCEIQASDPGSEYLLLRRVTGWGVIDLFATALRSRVLPTGDVVLRASAPPLVSAAGAWCAAAPLRHGYELAVASIDDADGAVAVSTIRLFGAGTAGDPGGDVRIPVELARADGQPGPVQLPILIAKGTEERAQLIVGHAELPDRGSVSCELVLRGPGDVEFGLVRSVQGGVAVRVSVAGTPSWPDIVRGLPSHSAFDVVLAVELSGSAGVVDSRLGVLRHLAHALRARDAAAPGCVRLAAIRYLDHPEQVSRRHHEPCQRVPFGTPEEVIDSVTRWHPSPPDVKYGSAMEDALHLARGLEWRHAVRRCLVVIGSRPPSVTSLGHFRGSVCPQKYVWSDELAALREELAVRCFAVVDEPPWMREPVFDQPVARTRACWRQLGADGYFELDRLTVSVSDLVDQLIPGPSAPLPLAVLTARGRDDT